MSGAASAVSGKAVSPASARYGRREALKQTATCFGLLLAAGGAARAQGAGPGEVRVLMLGDSITAGYGLARQEGPPARLEALLRERGRRVRVIDAGVSGDTTQGGRSRLDWSLAERPHAAIVALGGNDGCAGCRRRRCRQPAAIL
jgi:acyl-CoA thioesterase-1